jgi:hypothetical protein
MKYAYLKFIFFASLMFATSIAIAQSGAVYSFVFRIDPELTDYIKVDDKAKTWLSGYSESDEMPSQIIYSIKLKTEESFTNKLKMPVKLCYHKNKKGKEVSSVGVGGILEGLPSNTFNGGKDDCPQNSRYISMDVQIYPSGGTSITIGTTKTKLKPKLQIYAKVFDENKNEVWKKEIAIKDFAKLRSETAYYGSVEITKSEVLTPFDIYAMYLMGLDALMKE